MKQFQYSIPVLNPLSFAAFALGGGKFSTEPITPDGVRELQEELSYLYEDDEEEDYRCNAALWSFISDQSTVQVFNALMGLEGDRKLPTSNSQSVLALAPGEVAVVIAMKGRAPVEENEAAGYGLFILRRLE